MNATASGTIKNRRTAVIETAIDIACPAEEVFGYCSDHTNEIEWNPAMRRVAKITDGPVGAGTRYEMEFLPGRPMVAECVRFDPPTCWAVAASGGGMRLQSDGSRPSSIGSIASETGMSAGIATRSAGRSDGSQWTRISSAASERLPDV